MREEIARLSDELARSPSSRVFLELGEALRRQGELDVAMKVALRGIERHPHDAEAQDLTARVALERRDFERSKEAWQTVLRIAPLHLGARRGLGFISYKQGRLGDAERMLAEVEAADPADEGAAQALAHVRALMAERREARPPLPQAGTTTVWDAPAAEVRPPREAPAPARVMDVPTDLAHIDTRLLFADLIGEGEQTALLLDATGLVLAGAYVREDGVDMGQEIGGHLSGISDEAGRAMRHMDLGDWHSVTVEAERATVAMAPAPSDGLVVLAASCQTPLGYLRRLLTRVVARSAVWMEAAP